MPQKMLFPAELLDHSPCCEAEAPHGEDGDVVHAPCHPITQIGHTHLDIPESTGSVFTALS